MLLFCEFMLTLFRVAAVIMIGFIIFGVIPYFGTLLIDEVNAHKTATVTHETSGRHRKGTGKNDKFMTDIVIRFRDGRESIQHHRMVAHG
jgi:hypothetical protein